MINNLALIKPLLKFEDHDQFYFLQLLRRAKDGNDVGAHGNSVKNYYINNFDYLENKMPEIIGLCDYFNARAYIRLNRRSWSICALRSAQLLLEYINNKNPQSAKGVFSTAVGRNQIEKGTNKRWIVDLDEEGIGSTDTGTRIVSPELCRFIEYECEPISTFFSEPKVLKAIPTKNGFHLITSPFNVERFKQQYPTIDIQKDNPTILYCP